MAQTDKFKMIATTLYGLEDILSIELDILGANDIIKRNRAVEFKGDLACMYKVNMGCRTALRILIPISNFKAFNDAQLYKKAKSINWQEHIDLKQTFAISANVNSKIFKHSQYAALKVKDAIVDNFNEKLNQRPNINPKRPDVRIFLHIDKENCSFLIDSSGLSLHMRGYRMDSVEAPINEVLAAGILKLSNWKGQSDFLDPMCGSGTFCIEAALIALNRAPNLNRRYFGFMNFKNFELDILKKVKDELISTEIEFSHNIYGLDKEKKACEFAKSNIMRVRLSRYINIQTSNFFQYKPNAKLHHIVFNPPYGHRLEIDGKAFYSDIGDTFKQRYQGSKAWLISSDIDNIKYIGLKPNSRTKLINGKLECRLLEFEMYEGSRKAKFAKKQD